MDPILETLEECCPVLKELHTEVAKELKRDIEGVVRDYRHDPTEPVKERLMRVIGSTRNFLLDHHVAGSSSILKELNAFLTPPTIIPTPASILKGLRNGQ